MMTRSFTTDGYFHIGEQHVRSGVPCQDFVFHGTFENSAYAIVTDGCSTGGNTDIGARLLALSTARTLRERSMSTNDQSPEEFRATVTRTMAEGRKLLNLKENDMYATCAYVFVDELCGAASIFGDGVVALKYRDGSIDMHRVEWLDNMPYYLAYEGDSRMQFIAAHGGDGEAPRGILTTASWNREGACSTEAVEHFSLEQGMNGIYIPITPEMAGSLDSVAVFSDGVMQFDAVPWATVVHDSLQYRSITGAFVKRRMMSLIRESRTLGKGPIDDISVAVVHLTTTENPL